MGARVRGTRASYLLWRDRPYSFILRRSARGRIKWRFLWRLILCTILRAAPSHTYTKENISICVTVLLLLFCTTCTSMASTEGIWAGFITVGFLIVAALERSLSERPQGDRLGQRVAHAPHVEHDMPVPHVRQEKHGPQDQRVAWPGLLRVTSHSFVREDHQRVECAPPSSPPAFGCTESSPGSLDR